MSAVRRNAVRRNAVRRNAVRRNAVRASAIVALLAAAARPLAAQGSPTSPIRARTTYEDLQMLTGVLNQIRVNHPDSVEAHELIMAAIEGMVHAADPHSYVIPAMRLEPGREKAWREGKLYPVPIAFAFFGGSPVVVSVPAGSAAARADILPGDELIAAGGAGILAQSSEELEMALAGSKNSVVSLTFERRRGDGSLVQLERPVKRERIGEETAVPGAFMLDAETGYVRITTFVGERVADDLHKALERLEDRGMKRLVLDLRDNGGGSVAEAAHVAGEFLPKGAVVYTSEGRKADVTDTGRVGRSFWRSERRYPIVVMVNSGTASASELVAGALQDHDRALIVGRPSFGKALLMRGFPIPDGSAIVMVVGHVKTPCGRVVQRQYRGITRHDYYRLARAARDTAGRPSCRTDGGRVVYGGGGIFPDVVLPETQAMPRWLERVGEDALPLKWIAGYLGANPTAYASLDALAAQPALAGDGLAQFRRFAADQGVPIPDGPESDRLVERALVRRVAEAKWGLEGYYRISAVLDREIAAAAGAFDKARAILAGGR